MPALKNATHEAMCRDVAGGMSREAAWRAAGFGSRNSTRFFKRPKIAARVRELQEQFAEGSKLQLAYLQESLLMLARGDYANYYEKVPNTSLIKVKDFTKLPPEMRACISDVVIGRNGAVVGVKLHDPKSVLETLARTCAGTDGAEVSVNVGVGIAARLDAAIAQLSPEDQRVLADALDALSQPDGAGDRVAANGAGAGGAGVEIAPQRSVMQEALQPVQIGDRL